MTSGQFACPRDTLNLEYSLMSGQAFRWRRDAEGWWACLLPTTGEFGARDDILLRVRQDDDMLSYEGSRADAASVLRDYFRLDVDLLALCARFAAEDPFLAVATARFPGLRVLRQHPVENLFSFLCTSAAPLHRIRRSITGLCREYGGAGVEAGGVRHFPFPSVDALAGADVGDMRALGLGYRARYIQQTARHIQELGGSDWLFGLRALPYLEAKAALLTLPGVGEKIADCTCLFSLDKDAAIPVDTHIRRIAGRDYGAGADARSLTPAVYALIGETLRARFGPLAGWAQQFLFFHEIYGEGAWEAYAALYREGETPK